MPMLKIYPKNVISPQQTKMSELPKSETINFILAFSKSLEVKKSKKKSPFFLSLN
jgi:hypothetical protein